MPTRLDQIPGDTQQPQSNAPGLEVQGVTLGRSPSIRLGTTKERVIPQGQLKAIEDTDKSINRLQGLIDDMNKNKYQTGPASPRFYRGNIGNVAMQYRGSSEEANFKAANERFLNEYLTAQTGAQRGFKEIQWLSTAVPNAGSDLPENYVTKAKSTLEELRTNRESMVQTLKDAGYNYQAKNKQKEDPLGLR